MGFMYKGEEIPTGGGTDITAGDGMSKDGNTLNVDNPVQGIYTQEEFDALTEAQKAKGTYFVDDGQSGGDSSGEVYSTQEIRIGTWIDGKPLYRKVYRTTTPSSTGEAKPIVPLPQNIEKTTSLLGQFLCNNQELFINYYANAQYYVTTYVNYSMNYVVMNISHNAYTNCPLVIVLEYTKITDQAPVDQFDALGTMNAALSKFAAVTTDPEVSA